MSSEAAGVARHGRLLIGGVAVGAVSGLASAGFLAALDGVTRVHRQTPTLLWLLPAAGLAVGLVFHRWGGRAVGGTRLTMAEIDDLRDGVPLRMAPLVLVGTLMTHLFGGSAGREGTAIQMSAGITDGLGRRLGVVAADQRILLVAALAGGFGSVFGVPWAGLVFALEVAPTTRRRRVVAVLPSMAASWIGHLTVGWVGVAHHRFPRLGATRLPDLGRLAIGGIAFGLVAWSFVALTDHVRSLFGRWVAWPPLRPAAGGAAVILLTLAIGTRDYNGLSLPLLDRALDADDVEMWAFAFKALLTAVTVGSGLPGGEVTPLFVVGATTGATVAGVIGGPVAVIAGVGMVATFGAAANASVACVVMGVELFGWDALAPLVVGCSVARLVSSRRHLYGSTGRSVDQTAADR